LKTCSTGKKIYNTERMAEEALIAAWVTYQFSAGNGPVGVYHCDDCGHCHLTSKGPLNKRLDEHIKAGKIERSKIVQVWESKLKKKGKA
jgi:hypothetical protein